MLGAAANAVIAVGYFLIAWQIFRGVQRTGQWRSNPLAIATGLIFFTCAAGHGAHVEHLLLPNENGDLARQSWDLHLSLLDTVTAAIAVYYWTLRSRFPALIRGTAVFEDLTLRRRQALDLHDHVVQQLATAKLAFEMGQTEEGMDALDAGLDSSRHIISDLVGSENVGEMMGPTPGRLRRERNP